MLENALQLFSYKDNEIRTIIDEHGEPWLVVADVCKALDITNYRDAASRLDEDERGVVITDTPGGPQEMLYANEPGLYELIFTSRKPEAKAFKRWVKHEVLPAIRKTGKYSVSQEQFAEVKTTIQMITDNPEKLPWGLSYAELGDCSMVIPHIYRCIDDINVLLARGRLTEKQTQKFQDTLTTLIAETKACHDTLREDLKTNRHIDDLFFKMRTIVHHLALPDPSSKSE